MFVSKPASNLVQMSNFGPTEFEFDTPATITPDFFHANCILDVLSLNNAWDAKVISMQKENTTIHLNLH